MIAMDIALARGRHRDSIAKSIGAWISLWRTRRRFNRLLDLDDRMLDDIGVTRAEVLRASRLPLRVSAGREMRIVSERRRAKERWQ